MTHKGGPEVRLRDVIPIWRLDRLREQRRNRLPRSIDHRQPTRYDNILHEIIGLPLNWHQAGVCGSAPLRAIALHGQGRPILHSAETGVGKSTLLLSHVSHRHMVFAVDDAEAGNSLNTVRTSPLLKKDAVTFIVGPTQETLPRHNFTDRLQLVLIDGPHAYPFPELEYYFFYPHLDEGALLILDDLHIPTIFRLFSFLREEEMFDFLGLAATAAFFRRNSNPLFDPLGDGWWRQKYNEKRFPVRRFKQDFVPPGTPLSSEFKRLFRDVSN